MDLLTSLLDQSFSPKEAQIYLTCLQLKQANASTIARVSGHNRSTTYSILKELQTKGYINVIDKNNILTYSAVQPDMIAQQLEDKFIAFKELLPAFSAFSEKFGIAPKVEFFEGQDSIAHMYDDTLTTKSELCAFLGTSQFPDYIQKYLSTKFFREKIKKNIISKTLLSDTAINRKNLKNTKSKIYKRERKIVPELQFLENIIINIYGPNKVMFAVFHDDYPFGVIISSHYLYETLLNIFTFLRKQSKTTGFK